MSDNLGQLYLVAVPIGNLEDITMRALRILREADVIACEDTRQTTKLLELLGVSIPTLISTHEHNEARRVNGLLERLAQGQTIALVSDAGTPTVSDPGYTLVREAIKAGFQPIPLPGPCAAITALCASGLSTAQFRFLGFLPHKSGPLRKALEGIRHAQETVIYYVGPHHLEKVLKLAHEVLGSVRHAVIARELTKKFESFQRGTLDELVRDPGTVRGEMVLIFEAASGDDKLAGAELDALIVQLRHEGLAASQIAKQVARMGHLARAEAYRRVMDVLD